MTQGVKINSIILDDKEDSFEDVVTVDFSSHLLSEMNAGAGVESMILRSIVNTLGEYYQRQRVVITVDGKPYSSGHILMGEGEYFEVDIEGTVHFE